MNAKLDENSKPTIICASNADGTTIIPAQANPASHGVKYDDNTTGNDNGNNNGGEIHSMAIAEHERDFSITSTITKS